MSAPKVADDGAGNLTVACATCGNPITVSTADGMFCEDRHGEAESKAAREKVDALLDLFRGRSG